MKKLNITKEQFNKSRYFKNKYGRLEYVSESGKMFKTNKGQVLMFNESDLMNDDEEGEPVIDYQVKFVHVVLFAEYLSRPLKINVHLKGGRCTGASVQKADAQYNSDPWISWLPGKKLKTGGEFYGPTGLFDLAEDRKFKNWLEELVRDIESKYA